MGGWEGRTALAHLASTCALQRPYLPTALAPRPPPTPPTTPWRRRFIRASRPDMTQPYRLATAFPPKQLDDDSATIEAAGLANSVVVQKL